MLKASGCLMRAPHLPKPLVETVSNYFLEVPIQRVALWHRKQWHVVLLPGEFKIALFGYLEGSKKKLRLFSK